MSDKQDELKNTADSDPIDGDIELLKDEEKEKLNAAAESYSGTETAEHENSPGSGEPRVERKLAWLPGVILIGVGIIFLLNNTTDFQLHNWWALFIMIPAIGSFSKAFDAIRREGELTRDAWGALAFGLILTLVTCAFLFNLDWGLIWPVFLIIGGLGLFVGAWKG